MKASAGTRPDRRTDGTGTDARIRRAGLGREISPSSVLTARLACLVLALVVTTPIAGFLPGSAGALLVALSAGLAFLVPDLVLARRARARRRRVVAALPDALDLLATLLGAGQAVGSAIGSVSRWGRGPLAEELSIVARQIEAGMPRGESLDHLRRRVGGTEIASFTGGLERSILLGSPLSRELRRQASELRVVRRRTIVERSARAAPKIQLVIALVLVPAVMLLIVAVLVANSGELLGAAFGTG